MKTIFPVTHPYVQNIRFIFVKDPDLHGRYARTDRCVAAVACPQCEAAIGELCKGADGKHKGSTHAVRRDLFKRAASEAA